MMKTVCMCPDCDTLGRSLYLLNSNYIYLSVTVNYRAGMNLKCRTDANKTKNKLQ